MTEGKKEPKKEKRPPAPRGRPEKNHKIDDTPRNVARSFFRMRSTKYAEKEENDNVEE